MPKVTQLGSAINVSQLQTQCSGLSSLFSPLLLGTSCFWGLAPVAGWVHITPESVSTVCPISFLKQRSYTMVDGGGRGRGQVEVTEDNQRKSRGRQLRGKTPQGHRK